MKPDKFMKSMEKVGKAIGNETKHVAGYLFKTKRDDIVKKKKNG